MKWTNKLGLNDAIAKAVMNDPYERGESHFTATELIKPPRIRALEKKHWDDLELDVSNHIFSLIGQTAHSILERSADENVLVEQRFYTEVEGYRISAQVDHLENGVLSDYKVTTVFKAKKDADISDFTAQLNIQKFILEENGKDIHKLQIVALLRDYSKMESVRAKQRGDEYPEMQVVVIPIPIWKTEDTRRFIIDRMVAHLRAEENLPECTEKDVWARPSKYAVMKPGRVSAIRLLDSLEEAKEYKDSLPKSDDLYIQKRPGAYIRCENYCVVGEQGFCEQKNKREKTGE